MHPEDSTLGMEETGRNCVQGVRDCLGNRDLGRFSRGIRRSVSCIEADPTALRRRWPITALYVATWAALIVLLWPGLGALRIPVALYALLLTGTAATSAGFGLRTGLGGLLFFVSDGLISLRLADLPQPPLADLWIMSTYIAAQYLLASGVLRAQRAASPTPQAAPAVV